MDDNNKYSFQDRLLKLIHYLKRLNQNKNAKEDSIIKDNNKINGN